MAEAAAKLTVHSQRVEKTLKDDHSEMVGALAFLTPIAYRSDNPA